MSITISVESLIDPTNWDTHLAKNPTSSLYQSWYWAKIYEDVFDSKPFFLLAKNTSGKVIGQLLVFIHTKYFWIHANPIIKKLYPKFNLGSIISWNYGPIIHDKNNANEINRKFLKSLDKLAIENNVIMIKGSSSLEFEIMNDVPFLENNFQVQDWGTYVIDLTQEKNIIYNNLDKKTRYDIRKSEKFGLLFEIADKKDTLDEYIELKHKEREQSNQKTIRIPLYNEKYWNYLFYNDRLKLFVARHNGKIVSGILAIEFFGHLIQHGVLNLRNDLLAGSFVTWNAIKWSIDNNYKTFDMGGFNPNPASEKEKNIDFFKSKWSGNEIHYHLYTKIINSKKFKLSSILIHPERLSLKLRSIFNY